MPAGPDATPDTLLIGGRQIAPRDVVTYALLEVVERDCDGQWLCFGLYLLVASLFMAGVVVGQLDAKYLIPMAFFAILAVMSLFDALAVREIGIYRIEVVTRTGERIVHGTPSLSQAAGLVRQLDALTRTRLLSG